MGKKETLPDGSIVLRGTRIIRVMTRLAPGVVLNTHYGFDDGEHHVEMVTFWEDEIRRSGRVHIFIDAARQPGMSSETRDVAAAWGKAHRAEVGAVEVLFHSRMMDMALSLVSMVMGMRGFLKTHSDSAVFERAVAAKVPGFRMPQHPGITAPAA